LGLTSDDLNKLICKVLTMMGKESILKENSVDSALSARDTLAKHIYEKLFNWLIVRVNE
jgi:myosin heavy subunit